MKIAVDFREAAKPQRAGKGEYVYQLVSAMLSQLSSTEELMLVVESGQKIALPTGRWQKVAIPGRSWLWHFGVLLWLVFKRPADIYFSTTSVIIPALALGVPTVMTIFDFTVWRFSKTHLPRAVWVEKLLMSTALRRSQHLLAISNFTKQEALELFKTNPEKISVTLLGFDSQFVHMSLAPDTITRLRSKYNLPPKFFLSLGTLEPRKNLTRITSAFTAVRDSLGDTELVVVGGAGWKLSSDELQRPGITLTGYIDDADRPAIYNLATALVFPSLYEGFGLPPLEAMACGTPVITSDCSSLPEVVGNAAIKIDPTSEAAIGQAMMDIVSSVDLRNQLSKKGLTQAQGFSWEKCAEESLGVLRNHNKLRG